jgi:hypothetical protein
MDRSSPHLMRPPSPPILGISGTNSAHDLSSTGGNNPQVIYKPNNQEVVYKQNIMVRWLQPPTPPPPAPIIIRGISPHIPICTLTNLYNRNSSSNGTSASDRMSANASMSSNTASYYCQVRSFLQTRSQDHRCPFTGKSHHHVHPAVSL